MRSQGSQAKIRTECTLLQGSTSCLPSKPYLGPTVRSLLQAEPDEPGVSHLHQDVIHAIDMDALHASPLHVLHNAMCSQGPVQAPVAICRGSKLLGTGATPGCLICQPHSSSFPHGASIEGHQLGYTPPWSSLPRQTPPSLHHPQATSCCETALCRVQLQKLVLSTVSHPPAPLLPAPGHRPGAIAILPFSSSRIFPSKPRAGSMPC